MKNAIQKLIFASLLMMVAGLSYGFSLWWVDTKGERLEQQASEVYLQQARETTGRNLRRTAEETAEDRVKLQQYFFIREGETSIDSLPDFLTAVEDYALRSAVTFETVSLDSKIDEQDKTEWLEMKFNISGSREQVVSFVRVLENLPYVLRINSVEFGIRSSQVWQAMVVLRIRVLAYGE